MKKLTKLIGALALIAPIVAFSMSTYAAEDENMDVSVQESAVAAYDELMNSFPQSRATGEKIYPDYYGGSYINENEQLVVYVTDLNFVPLVASAENNDTVIYRVCEYSYNELNNVMDTINEYKFANSDSYIADNFNSYALLDAQNRIEVRLDEYSEEKIQEFKDNVLDSNMIVFVEANGPIEDLVNLNAGCKINDGTYAGSMGYRARRNGVDGIVTAGHVIGAGQTLYYDATNTAIGTCNVSFSGNGTYDAAFCQITNSNYTPTNTLWGTSNTLSTTISEPGVGTFVNKIGYASGHTDGYITSTNATMTNTSGVTRTNMVEVECYATNGDSGGIFYSYVSSTNTRYTLGIVSAGDGTYTYYSKANVINSALGTSRY